MKELDPALRPTQLEPVGSAVEESKAASNSVGPSKTTLLFEACVTAVVVVILDVLLFQHGGPSAWAIALMLVGVVFVVLKHRTANWSATALFAALLLALSMRLVWSGAAMQQAVGPFIIGCLVLATSGMRPVLPEAFAFMPVMCIGAARRVAVYAANGNQISRFATRPMGGLAALVLPILVSAVFLGFFVMANPDVLTRVSSGVTFAFDYLGRALVTLSITQVVFWFTAAAIVLGGLHPLLFKMMPEQLVRVQPHERQQVKWFRSYSNTLVSVIVLFTAYLIFEFATLWFRAFPEDFYYAGYAHKGAAWLTVALAFSTALLSYFFRRSTLKDPRIGQLKALVLGWSVLNLLLTAAVYNRMWIYVQYNGMTQMRLIGLLGITAVAIGFVLVVWKVQRDHDFRWLIHRQLWAPASMVILFAVLPVDWLVSQYNVSRAASGDLAPAVQVIAQDYDASGALPLVRLIDHPEPEIRVGSRALLAQWSIRLGVAESTAQVSTADEVAVWKSPLGHSSPWARAEKSLQFASSNSFRAVPRRGTKAGNGASFLWLERALNFQLAEAQLRKALESNSSKLTPYLDSNARSAAINDFYRYAYRWY